MLLRIPVGLRAGWRVTLAATRWMKMLLLVLVTLRQLDAPLPAAHQLIFLELVVSFDFFGHYSTM